MQIKLWIDEITIQMNIEVWVWFHRCKNYPSAIPVTNAVSFFLSHFISLSPFLALSLEPERILVLKIYAHNILFMRIRIISPSFLSAFFQHNAYKSNKRFNSRRNDILIIFLCLQFWKKVNSFVIYKSFFFIIIF